MRNPFARLARRDEIKPTLRQRAAALKASAARVIHRKPIAAAEVTPTPSAADDAALLALGQSFAEAVTALEGTAAVCDRRHNAAWEARPPRPDCLTFREEDDKFGLRQTRGQWAGLPVTGADIEWMRSHPRKHQVLRDARAGERGWRDHPGKVPEMQPWPEAQARSDEIVAAWDKWQAARERVDVEHGVPDAERADLEVSRALSELADRIAASPARTAEGLRVKILALAFFDPTDADIDPGIDRQLLHSLIQDARGDPLSGALAVVKDPEMGRLALTEPHPLAAAILDHWAAWGATLGPGKDAATDAAYDEAIGRRHALLDAAEALPATPDSVVAKALAVAWLEFVEEERPGRPRAEHSLIGRIGLDIHAAVMGSAGAAERQEQAPSLERVGFNLADQIDFVSATVEELRALSNTANLVGSVADAVFWQGRCRDRSGNGKDNAAGRLMSWLGSALAGVEDAVEGEARRRAPLDITDRETRLSLLAEATIDNGDPDETTAFAHELLGLVASKPTKA